MADSEQTGGNEEKTIGSRILGFLSQHSKLLGFGMYAWISLFGGLYAWSCYGQFKIAIFKFIEPLDLLFMAFADIIRFFISALLIAVFSIFLIFFSLDRLRGEPCCASTENY